MRISAISNRTYLIALKSSCRPYCNWRVFFDLEMLLEDGEIRTRGWETLKSCSKMAKREPWNANENLEMLLEDGETRTRGRENLEIKNFMYPTPLQPFCEPAFLAPRYPRPPCVPSFIKSRTFRILPTHFLLIWNSLYVYTRGILGCLLEFGLWAKILRG